MESIIIYLTYKCNLSCDYCFIKKTNAVMNSKILRKILNWFIKQAGNIKKIDFMGGEPLLCVDLLVGIRGYLNKINKDNKKIIIRDVPTNGTIINEKIIRLLKKEGIELAFSLDGKEISHNSYRTKNRAIFNKIISNIEFYTQNYVLPRINLTVHPTESGKLYENILWLLNKGFKKIQISPAFGQVWHKEEIQAYKENFKKVTSFYFKKKIRGNKEISIEPVVGCIERINKQFLDNPNCGLGVEPVFTPEGKAYACTLIMNINDIKLIDKFSLGDIDTGINIKKMESLLNYRICDDMEFGCGYKFPESSFKKICTCFDFKTRKLFSRDKALAMIEIENIPFTLVFNTLKQIKARFLSGMIG